MHECSGCFQTLHDEYYEDFETNEYYCLVCWVYRKNLDDPLNLEESVLNPLKER